MSERCPVTSETLSAFVDGELPVDQRRKLAQHIVGCHSCSRRIGTIYSLKTLINCHRQQSVNPPRGFWKTVRQRLDEVDAIAGKVVNISPGPAPIWRVAALAATGILLILLALGVRQAFGPRRVGWNDLIAAHRAAVDQMPRVPVVAAQADSHTETAAEPAWQPAHTQAIYTQMCSGRQVIYANQGAFVSYFVLPCDSLEVSSLEPIVQAGVRFYVARTQRASVVAWRQQGGWRVLVGKRDIAQLLRLAILYRLPAHIQGAF